MSNPKAREISGQRFSASDAFWLRYTLSCSAATVAETATYPLDIVKTRMQIQGEQAFSQADQKFKHGGSVASCSKQALPNVDVLKIDSRKLGFFRWTTKIVTEEGMSSLWQGVSAAVFRHYIYTGVRIITYESMRENLFGHTPGKGSFPLWESMCAGMTSGVVAQFLASPADLVKVQMQMEGQRRLTGLPPRTKNMYQAFRLLLSEGGWFRLWRGAVPNCQRAGLVNMADLSTYDTVKHALLKNTSLQDNYVTHGLSSICSGLCAAIVSTPSDVVKTRIMNQPTDATGKSLLYTSTWDCLAKTVRNEGFWALYKGFWPIWARMAPWSLTFWISYEHIRQITGVESF